MPVISEQNHPHQKREKISLYIEQTEQHMIGMGGWGGGGWGLFANVAYIHHGRVDMLEAGQTCYGKGRQVLREGLTCHRIRSKLVFYTQSTGVIIS